RNARSPDGGSLSGQRRRCEVAPETRADLPATVHPLADRDHATARLQGLRLMAFRLRHPSPSPQGGGRASSVPRGGGPLDHDFSGGDAFQLHGFGRRRPRRVQKRPEGRAAYSPGRSDVGGRTPARSDSTSLRRTRSLPPSFTGRRTPLWIRRRTVASPQRSIFPTSSTVTVADVFSSAAAIPAGRASASRSMPGASRATSFTASTAS